jgi:5-methylcytosine-specific restriction protein B
MMSQADEIRRCACTGYVKPAKERGEKFVSILASDIAKKIKMLERMPNICQALSGKKFAKMCNVELIKISGTAPSGQSTTTKFTYKIL